MKIREKKWGVLLIVSVFSCVLADVSVFDIGTQEPKHTVSERFLSLSVDPKELLDGVNISYTSLLLAQHITPAFIRIAGPSTKLLRYSDEADDELSDILYEGDGRLVVTPSVFTALNDWLSESNLTPVFAINDVDKVNGTWDPKPWMPLFELSDRLNLSCYWQLGHDCSGKSEGIYREDLIELKHKLKEFPSRKDSWKIVGSDLSKCVTSMDNAVESVSRLVTAVMWEPPTTEKNTPAHTDVTRMTASKVEVWTTIPKCNRTASFNSGLRWAKQIGQASKIGYSVIFKEPKSNEILADTPTFWISVLHKKLMCRNVLEVSSARTTQDVFVYSHCAKPHHTNHKSGAVAIMVINNKTEPHTVSFQAAHNISKSLEMQVYLLTSSNESSVETYLNGEKLAVDKLDDENLLVPQTSKLRPSQLSYDAPGKSVTFIVLPNAQAPACILDEDRDKRHIVKRSNPREMENDQTSVKTSRKIRDIKELIEKARAGKHKREQAASEVEENRERNKLKRRVGDNDELNTIAKKKTLTDASEKKRKRYVRADKSQKVIKIIKSRMKREINMDLLKIKTENSRFSKKNNPEEKPVIVQPTYTQDETAEEAVDEKPTPKRLHHKHHAPLRPNHHETSRKRINDITRPSSKRNKGDEELSDAVEFLAEADGAISAQKDLRKYHNLHEKIPTRERTLHPEDVRNREVWEMHQRKAMPFRPPGRLDMNPDDYSYVGDSAEYYRSILGEPAVDYLIDGDYMDFETFPEDYYKRKKRQEEVSTTKKSIDNQEITRMTRDVSHRRSDDLADSYYYILGKPFDPAKVKVNQAKKNRQLQHLRNRMHRKKVQEVKNRAHPKIDAAAAMARRNQIKVGHDAIRHKRSTFGTNYKEFKFPKINHVYKEYIPKTIDFKEWKPEDILKLKSHKLKMLKSSNDVAKQDSWLMYKRNERNAIESSENKVECSINDIEKDSVHAQFVRQTLDEAENEIVQANNGSVANTTEQAEAASSKENITEALTVQPPTAKSVEVASGEHMLTIGEDLEYVKLEDPCGPSWFQNMYRGIGNILQKMTNQLKSLIKCD